jgi:hypothetical protein
VITSRDALRTPGTRVVSCKTYMLVQVLLIKINETGLGDPIDVKKIIIFSKVRELK